MTMDAVANLFRQFAEHECQGSSALYFQLSRQIAQDQKLLSIAAKTTRRQPIPNLFFAAVQFLLHRSADIQLKEYYASFTQNPLPPAESFIHFKNFAIQHQDSIINILQSRLVQTNEVKRSAYLYPAIGLVSQLNNNQPICLIEIGASAGFNLCFDKYKYQVGDLHYGDTASDLLIHSEFKTQYPYSPIVDNFDIYKRIAIDLNIIDLKNADDQDWMQALIWPEHRARLEQLKIASQITRNTEIQYLQGDAVELINELVLSIPKHIGICVYHTHVANQMSTGQREGLVKMVDQLGSRGNLYHLYNNIDSPELQLVHFPKGMRKHITLAKTEGHGKWVEWSGASLL